MKHLQFLPFLIVKYSNIWLLKACTHTPILIGSALEWAASSSESADSNAHAPMVCNCQPSLHNRLFMC